jgi:outer membrane protein OmpA-like peptidoglycan-associated protein
VNLTRICAALGSTAALLMGSAAPAASAAVPPDAHPIPYIDGLTVMRATSLNGADYETVGVLGEATPASVKWTMSAEAPDDSGEVREITVSRTLRREDLKNSRTIRSYYHEGDPAEFPGTTSGFSALMINELHTLGRTSATYLEVEPEFGVTVVTRTMTGSLVRVGPGPEEVSVIVNGRPQVLRALHVAGHLADDGDGDDFDYVVLDDPDCPLTLRSKGPRFATSVSRIEFPVAATAATSLESALTRDKRALVYGIYFKFARSDIRPVSEPVLKEIAAVMKKNPDWTLNIAGHTDNVGGDASNLDLSRRRADSVKAALVGRYGIAAGRLTTGGFGASQPQATNATPEGRARNRRVELTRP